MRRKYHQKATINKISGDGATPGPVVRMVRRRKHKIKGTPLRSHTNTSKKNARVMYDHTKRPHLPAVVFAWPGPIVSGSRHEPSPRPESGAALLLLVELLLDETAGNVVSGAW